jgi:ketosteroid isomerase-like protein
MKSSIMKKMIICGILLLFYASNAQDLNQELQTRKTVENFLSAFGESNPDKIAGFVAENVDWYIFESKVFPWTGKRTKRSEIPEVFKTLFSYFVPGKEKVTIDSFLVDGNNAALFLELGRQFKHSGKDFTMFVAIHFHVDNGLINKFYLYEQTPILEKAYRK